MGSVELTPFFRHGLDFDIVRIKSILMVSGCQTEHLEGSGVNRRLQRDPVVAGSLVRLTFKGGIELLFFKWEFQLFGVKSFCDFLSLGSTHVLNMQLCLGDDATMICPTVRTAHCLGHSYFLPVLNPEDDIVNDMPVLGARLHPRCHVAGRETEHGIGNGQAMCGTGPEQMKAVTVAFPSSMVSDDSFPNLVVFIYAIVVVTDRGV